MRPNIDVPWSLHGQIKEFSATSGATIEESYLETLRKGIDQMDVNRAKSESEQDRELDPVYNGSLDNIQFTTVATKANTTPVTFGAGGSSGEEALKAELVSPSVFASRDDDSVEGGLEALGLRLSELAEKLSNPSRAAFAMVNGNGLWYGWGLGDFYTALREIKQRYERRSDEVGHTHHSEAAFLTARIDPYGTIGIGMQPDAAEGYPRHFNVSLTMNGYPLDTAPYRGIADIFGSQLTTLRGFKDRDGEAVTIKDFEIEIDEDDIQGFAYDWQPFFKEPSDQAHVHKIIVSNPFIDGLPEMLHDIRPTVQAALTSMDTIGIDVSERKYSVGSASFKTHRLYYSSTGAHANHGFSTGNLQIRARKAL